jgi:hypothetical protein
MPLTLRPNPDTALERRQSDHVVMSGELQVGRIYKRESTINADSQWLWAINGVQRAGPDVMRVAGLTTTLEAAQAELSENWQKWLAWAHLQELSDAARPANVAAETKARSGQSHGT